MVFVVFIHNGISEKNFTNKNVALEIPVYVEIVQNFIYIIVAVAVPLFFLISSFLLYTRENKFSTVLKKKIRTILIPYILWNLIFILFYHIMQSLPFTKAIFNSAPDYLIRNYGFYDWLKAFLGDYTNKKSLTSTPFDYPLWFIRDLFILNILFIGIKKIIDKAPFGIIVIFFILWIANIKIYIVSPEALLFFSFGYYIVKYSLNEARIDIIRMSEISLIYLITIIMELFFNKYIPIIHKINIIIGSIFFLKASWYFVRNKMIYTVLIWCGQYGFIVYAIHAFILPQLLKLSINLFLSPPPAVKGWLILVDYFLIVLLGIVLSILFGILLKKIVPKVYAVLTGGRV
jgi:fucose 4-O-acetylase-like acetyltransferase